MTKLCPRGKAAAKRKFDVYPSAYANAYASKICAGKIKDPSGVKRKDFRGSKAKGGLMEATKKLKAQGLQRGGRPTVKGIQRREESKNRKGLGKSLKSYGDMIKRKKQKNKPGSPDNPITLKKGGFVARGCGAIMSNRKKKTRFA